MKSSFIARPVKPGIDWTGIVWAVIFALGLALAALVAAEGMRP